MWKPSKIIKGFKNVIYQDATLCKFLLVESENPLDPSIHLTNIPYKLSKAISTYVKVPSDGDSGCKLNIVSDDIRLSQGVIMNNAIEIDVLVPENLWNCEEDDRIQLIMERLVQLFNDSGETANLDIDRGFIREEVGVFEFVGSNYIKALIPNYSGYHLVFRTRKIN